MRHPIFISYSSTAVMKYQDQGNLEKEESSRLKGQRKATTRLEEKIQSAARLNIRSF